MSTEEENKDTPQVEESSSWGGYFTSTLSSVVNTVTETSNSIGAQIQNYVEGDGDDDEKKKENTNDNSKEDDENSEDFMTKASKSMGDALSMGSEYASSWYSSSKAMVNSAVESSSKYLNDAEEVKFVRDSMSRAATDTANFGLYLVESLKKVINEGDLDSLTNMLSADSGEELAAKYIALMIVVHSFEEHIQSKSADTKLKILSSFVKEERIMEATMKNAELATQLQEMIEAKFADKIEQDFAKTTTYGQAVHEIVDQAKETANTLVQHKNDMLKENSITSKNCEQILTNLSKQLNESNKEHMAEVLNIAFLHLFSLSEHLVNSEKELTIPIEFKTLPHLQQSSTNKDGVDDPQKTKPTVKDLATLIHQYCSFIVQELDAIKTAYCDASHSLKTGLSDILSDDEKKGENSLVDKIDDIALKSYSDCILPFEPAKEKYLSQAMSYMVPVIVYAQSLQKNSE